MVPFGGTLCCVHLAERRVRSRPAQRFRTGHARRHFQGWTPAGDRHAQKPNPERRLRGLSRQVPDAHLEQVTSHPQLHVPQARKPRTKGSSFAGSSGFPAILGCWI